MKPSWTAVVISPIASMARPARRCRSGIMALPANQSDVPASCAATIAGRIRRGTGFMIVGATAKLSAPRRIAPF